ncbi:unnamed protein product [Rhizopus stolonifer]
MSLVLFSRYNPSPFFTGISNPFLKPISIYAGIGELQERGDSIGAGNWAEAPGAFPSGGYQNVRDGDAGEFA